MACGGCGAKYRRTRNVSRSRLPVSSKYKKARKLPKPAAPVPAKPKAKKIDPQLAVSVLSTIAGNISK